MLNASLVYQWAEGLSSTLQMGHNFIDSRFSAFFPQGVVAESVTGYKQVRNSRFATTTLDFSTHWETQISDRMVGNVTVGGQSFREVQANEFASVREFGSPTLKTLSGGAQITGVSEGFEEVINAGLFVQGQVGLDDRLSLTGGVRADGNSAFGEDFGLQVYPKAGVSWVVSEYDFWNVGWMNELRLRAALGAVAEEIFPEGTTVKKGPAYFTDKRQVHYDLLNISERQSSELRERFREITGFDLVISNIGDAQDPAGEAALAPANVERMEINAAYGLIRARLKGCGLGKTSLKQGQIVLGFVSPQVGQRHQERINQLAEETGYNLVISPHPNQYEILRVANRLIAENNWMIAKGPGIHDDRGELRLEFAKPVPAAEIESFSEKLEAQTGFKLAVQS